MSVEGVVVVVLVVVFLLAVWLPERPIAKCTRRNCGLGPGYHVHSAEGRTHMTPEQRVAMRESLERARQWHERGQAMQETYWARSFSELVAETEEYNLAIFRWSDVTIETRK